MTFETPPNSEKKPKEIERKFLIDAIPPEIDLDSFESEEISQGYLAVDENGAVRIRQKGSRFFITYKSQPTGHAAERVELETELTEEQFNALWPGTQGRRVEKTRYRIPFEGYVIELDIFEGDNAGHMLAEVEFPTTAESDAIIRP